MRVAAPFLAAPLPPLRAATYSMFGFRLSAFGIRIPSFKFRILSFWFRVIMVCPKLDDPRGRALAALARRHLFDVRVSSLWFVHDSTIYVVESRENEGERADLVLLAGDDVARVLLSEGRDPLKEEDVHRQRRPRRPHLAR